MQTKTLHGTEGLKQVFDATLNNKEKFLRTALASKPLVSIIGEEYANDYVQKREGEKIFLRSLRFSKQNDQTDNDFKETRTASDDLTIQTSFVIWDDNVVLVSKDEEIRILWITDASHAESVKNWYDFIWNNSN